MKARGKLRKNADLAALATATMASIQGGLLLTQVRRDSGSIYEVGGRFQSFRINDLEMVDQNRASWNPFIGWLRAVDCLRRIA